MLKGLYTGWTGMLNEQNRLDVVSNNLANSATVGFKKEGATSQTFKEALAYKIKDASENPNIAKRIGANTPGVKIGETYTNYDQGPMKETGNSTDFAISGNGFFNIEYTDADGNTSTKYTRAGDFIVDADRYLVTSEGNRVLDTNGRAIRTATTGGAIQTAADGTIYQDGTRVAQIGITDFTDYNYLEHFGDTLFTATEGATEQPATVKVNAGYLENSNVEIIKEMVDMIAIQRAYESGQKVIQTQDGALDIAVNQLGKL
ncbi:MAG: flagellar basal-body rod protein FlgF [Lachnospiraceae bacterium]|nr:flagellar basal-body rod protein FlgF [Lachnospiraceae bacterium]